MIRAVLVGVVGVLAAAALAISLVALERKNPPSLAGRLGQLEARIAALEQQASSQATSGPRVSATVQKIVSCLPELTAYVNGQQLQNNNGSLYLSDTQQISSFCTSLLYGH